MAINQLTTANTFSQWLNATQALISVANTLTYGNGSTFTANTILEIAGIGSSFNVRTSSAINELYSNTASISNATIGNANVTNTIIFSDATTLNSNVIIVRSFTQANAAFLQANTPSHVANSASFYANSGFEVANSASNYANSGFSHANSGFTHANSGFSHANSGFTHANSGFISANSASSYANSGFVHANSGFVQSNSAFIHANAAFIRANNSLNANSGGTVTGSITISTGGSQSLSATGNIVAPLFVGTATSARYADLAEKYLADADYSIGTLMSIGGEKEVTQSTITTRPIGVVSKNPAYMMNSDLEGGIYVALKGRVPIRVIGIVKKGFPLVVSNTPGIAQEGTWNDNYFAVALESSDSFDEKIIEGIVL